MNEARVTGKAGILPGGQRRRMCSVSSKTHLWSLSLTASAQLSLRVSAIQWGDHQIMNPPTTSVNRTENDKLTRTRSKKTNPLLMLLQRGFYRSRKTEYFRQRSSESEFMTPESPVSPGEAGSWVDTVSLSLARRPSCSSSRGLSRSDTCPSDVSRVTCNNLNTWSSSWTSWTKPIVGHSQDSCQPHTSILENVNKDKLLM